MKQKTIMSTLALMAMIAFAACSGDELPDDPSFDQEIKTELVDKSLLPEWLSDYIDYLEYVPEGQELPKEPSGIYRFEWIGKSFYEFYSPTQARLHEKIFTSDGAAFDVSLANTKTFSDQVTNWTIVYLLQPTHQKPENHYYPVASINPAINDSTVQRLLTYQSNPNEFIPFGHYCYIINSEKQFRDLFGSHAECHDIDFNQNTLVVGIADVCYDSYQIWQEISVDHDVPTLKVYYGNYQGNNQALFPKLIWALYPKLQYESGKTIVYTNNQEGKGMGDFISPNQKEVSTWSLLAYSNQAPIFLEEKNTDYMIQFAKDGTIKGKAGSTTFTGKVEFSNIQCISEISDDCFFYGDIRITLDDVDLSEEKDPIALYLIQNIKDVSSFSYWPYTHFKLHIPNQANFVFKEL